MDSNFRENDTELRAAGSPTAQKRKTTPEERALEEAYAKRFRNQAMQLRARRNRTQLRRSYLVICLTLFVAFVLLWAAGVVRTSPDDVGPSADTRFLAISGVWLLLFLTSIGIFLISIFRAGWFGEPEDPEKRKWGIPQVWHNAFRRAGQRDFDDIAPGLTRLLTVSMDVRLTAIYIGMVGTALLVSGILIFLAILAQFSTVEFLDAASARIGVMVTTLRNLTVVVLGGTPSASPVDVDKLVLLLMLFSMPAIIVLFGLRFHSKSLEMTWAFLPTPNVVREHLYYFLKAENTGREYSEARANSESLEFMLKRSLPLAPEHFIDSDGNLAFYHFDEIVAEAEADGNGESTE